MVCIIRVLEVSIWKKNHEKRLLTETSSWNNSMFYGRQNRNQPIATQNKLMVAKIEGVGGWKILN